MNKKMGLSLFFISIEKKEGYRRCKCGLVGKNCAGISPDFFHKSTFF